MLGVGLAIDIQIIVNSPDDFTVFNNNCCVVLVNSRLSSMEIWPIDPKFNSDVGGKLYHYK